MINRINLPIPRHSIERTTLFAVLIKEAGFSTIGSLIIGWQVGSVDLKTHKSNGVEQRRTGRWGIGSFAGKFSVFDIGSEIGKRVREGERKSR